MYRNRCRTLIFTYNRSDLSLITVETEENDNNKVYFGDGIFKVKDKNYYNTRVNIKNIENNQNKQETYSYYVSDKNNNTIGVLQYSFNYIQPEQGDITTLNKLEGFVSFSSGIFKTCKNAKVNQQFDNESANLPRTIYIY